MSDSSYAGGRRPGPSAARFMATVIVVAAVMVAAGAIAVLLAFL